MMRQGRYYPNFFTPTPRCSTEVLYLYSPKKTLFRGKIIRLQDDPLQSIVKILNPVILAGPET